jgi:hypothetical protein
LLVRTGLVVVDLAGCSKPTQSDGLWSYQAKLSRFRNSGKRGNEQPYPSRAGERKLRFEVRQILLDDLPNNLYIDVEIIVNDAISQADDFAPLNLGALGLEILRQAVGGFTELCG